MFPSRQQSKQFLAFIFIPVQSSSFIRWLSFGAERFDWVDVNISKCSSVQQCVVRYCRRCAVKTEMRFTFASVIKCQMNRCNFSQFDDHIAGYSWCMVQREFSRTSTTRYTTGLRSIVIAWGRTRCVHHLCWSNHRQFICTAPCSEIWKQKSSVGHRLSTNCNFESPLSVQCLTRFNSQMFWMLTIYAQNVYYLYLRSILEGFIAACLVVSVSIFSIEISHDKWVLG